MRSRNSLTSLLFLLTILAMCSGVSNVYASKVEISQLQFPNAVTYGQAGMIHVKAAITYTITGSKDPSLGTFGLLVVDLMDTSGRLSGSDIVVTSNPDSCRQSRQSGVGISGCAMFAAVQQFSETFDFAFAGSHIPFSPVWNLKLNVTLVDSNGAGGIGGGAYAYSNIAIPVLGVPTTSRTSASPTVTRLQFGLIVAVIVLVALVFFLSYSWRGILLGRPKDVQSAKSFCIECGKELSSNSKFCNNCGTKQP